MTLSHSVCSSLSAAVIALLLSSCSTNRYLSTNPPILPDAIQRDQRNYYYECSSEFTLPVSIKNDEAWLFLNKKTIRLPHVRSGSGAKYSDGTNTYWSKGEEASFETVVGSFADCRNNPLLAVWEHARITGANFRAVGNEPGWHLELRKDHIDYTGNYGTERQRYPLPEKEFSRNRGQTIYRAGDCSGSMTILLDSRECFDTMSGERFETTVTIRQNGNRLQGCGRALR